MLQEYGGFYEVYARKTSGRQYLCQFDHGCVISSPRGGGKTLKILPPVSSVS